MGSRGVSESLGGFRVSRGTTGTFGVWFGDSGGFRVSRALRVFRVYSGCSESSGCLGYLGLKIEGLRCN